MNILVLGGGGPAGINFCIAAYEAGHQAVVCDVDPVALQAARGRYKYLVEPDRDPQVINELCEKHDVKLVHAQPDPEVHWLAAYQHELTAPTLLPDRAALYVASDKYRTALVAGRDAPPTVALNEGSNIAEAIEWLGGDCWLRLRTGAGSAGALPVEDAGIAEAWIRHHERFGIGMSDWILSERLTGRDLSYTGVWRDGDLLAFGIKERLRLHGASRNPARIASTANLQVTTDRVDVRSVVHRVVEALPGTANGVMMFDLREDRHGTPRLTEINCGRFGTTSLHWHHAGLSLVSVYVEASRREEMGALGRRVPDGCAWYRELDSGSMKVTL